MSVTLEETVKEKGKKQEEQDHSDDVDPEAQLGRIGEKSNWRPISTHKFAKAVVVNDAVVVDDKEDEAQLGREIVEDRNRHLKNYIRQENTKTLRSCCCVCFFVLFLIFVIEASSGGGSSSHSSYGGGGGGCFPGHGVVEVQSPQQSVQLSTFKYMKDVQVGDHVRSGVGFSQVYAFGTKINGTEEVTMLQFHTESGLMLETTENHFVPTYHHDSFKGNMMLAQDVKIGDHLSLFQPTNSTTNNDEMYHQLGVLALESPQKSQITTRVTAIISIAKQDGAYHPLTNDGHIVVNGVLASVHAIDGIVPYVAILGVPIIGIQGFQQLLYSPLRILCRASSEAYCSEVNHDIEDGSHLYLNVVEPLLRFLMPSVSWTSQVNSNNEQIVNFLDYSPHFVLRVCLVSSLLFISGVEVVLMYIWPIMILVVVAQLLFWAVSGQGVSVMPALLATNASYNSNTSKNNWISRGTPVTHLGGDKKKNKKD